MIFGDFVSQASLLYIKIKFKKVVICYFQFQVDTHFWAKFEIKLFLQENICKKVS